MEISKFEEHCEKSYVLYRAIVFAVESTAMVIGINFCAWL